MSKVSNDNKMVNKKYSEIISKDILYDNANTLAENLLWEANKKEDKEDKSKLEDNNIKLEGNSAIAENIKKENTNKSVSKAKMAVTKKLSEKKEIISKAEQKKKVKSNQESSKIKEVDVKEKSQKTSIERKAKKVSNNELTSFSTYLFHQGKNYASYEIMGSHIKTENRKKGVQFATWAPNAKAVYLVGDFNEFKISDEYKLEKITDNGLWKAFFTNIKEGDKYKYCIIDRNGKQVPFKADPYAIKNELRPNTASIVYKPKSFKWSDTKWINKRNRINVLEQPLNIYEVHLGSWKRNDDGEFLTYDELSEELPKYVKEMNYTHVELMPLVEHPLDASWGYQGTGYYAPTSRYGSLEGLKKLINKLHEENIGVIMDWAPGHFCKDAHGLYKFAGEPTYEYKEEWKADNKDWGTYSFDLGRPEVKSYLISNALYWYREFHIDGLRVDAVSSILYLDYSKNNGEWEPNKYGGNGNLEAIQFLKDLNQAVFAEFSTALMIAEESTAWPNVTKPVITDGLGFNLKWNMGWMNDTLEYIELKPEYREYHHKNITFAMMYNYAENYILTLSHDEVVHGKKSLIGKMAGDEWNKFAGLRAYIGYMIGHPGKKLSFMGNEFAQDIEWREYESLKWNLIEENELNKKTQIFFKDINKLYIDNKALWELDYDNSGFEWIEANNNQQSVLIFNRKSRKEDETLIFIVNFKSQVYYDYQIGVPFLGEYEELFNTDDTIYGGSGQVMGTVLTSEKVPFHNQPYSIKIKVPPMATLILSVKKILKDENQEEMIR